MRHRPLMLPLLWMLAALGLAAGTAGCSSAAEEEPVDDAALTVSDDALEASDFSGALDKRYVKTTQSYLSDADFATKWKASTSDSAFMFFRTYPGAYHGDFATNLKTDAKKKIPNAVGICFGDAHPDNFGFLQLGSNVVYKFNDLDDSGYCPVALDALRYVTAVRIGYDKDSAERVADHYVDVLTGEINERDANADIAKVRDKQAPDFAERKAKKLDELTKDDQLRLDTGMARVSGAARTAIEAAVTQAFARATVLDVASVPRDVGGSGGLDRYWVLLRRGSSRTIIELKEAGPPGVEQGLSARPIPLDKRLALLKRELWNSSVEDDYFYVTALKKTFLARDRMAKASLDLTELSKGDLKDVFDAQAALVGLVHKSTAKLKSEDAKTMKRWLTKSAEALADRWKRGYHDG